LDREMLAGLRETASGRSFPEWECNQDRKWYLLQRL